MTELEMKPADEQIKEFWEWCGFKRRPDQDFVMEYQKHEVWEWSDGNIIDVLPKLDLNNLFKYAVPKLDIERINLYPATKDRWGCYFDDWYQDHNVAETPALALFWALWGVKETSGRTKTTN